MRFECDHPDRSYALIDQKGLNNQSVRQNYAVATSNKVLDKTSHKTKILGLN